MVQDPVGVILRETEVQVVVTLEIMLRVNNDKSDVIISPEHAAHAPLHY